MNLNKQVIKESPDTALWDKESLVKTVDFFFCWRLLQGTQPTLEQLLSPLRLPWRKLNFICSGHQLEKVSGLWRGACVNFFLHKDPIWCMCMQALCLLPQFLWVPLFTDPTDGDGEDLVSLVSSIPSCLESPAL